MNGMNPKVLNILAKQQSKLAQNAPDGVIFYQNEDGDVTDIQADIVGPKDTPFYGGIFKCKLVIDSDFPSKPPKGYFLTKIFHPNVASNGDICVNTLKRDWNPADWSLSHIFQIIKCLLIVPFPESALNEEAGRLFMESYDDFYNQAKIYTQIHARPNAKQSEIIQQQKTKEEPPSKQEKVIEEQETISLSGFNKSEPGVLGLSQVQNSSIGFGSQNSAFGFDKKFAGENQNQDQSNAQNCQFNSQGLFGQNEGFGAPVMNFGDSSFGQLGMGSMGMNQPAATVIKPTKTAKSKKNKCRI